MLIFTLSIFLSLGARASTTMVLCEQHLDPKASALLESQVYDRKLSYGGHQKAALAVAFERLGLSASLTDKEWANLILSVWVPKRPGMHALTVELFRFDRRRLLRATKFELPHLKPTLWTPLNVTADQAVLPYADVLALDVPKSPLPSPMDYKYVGYQSESAPDGTRVFMTARYTGREYAVSVQLGLDVHPEEIARYAFPDQIEDGQVTRVKTPNGDVYRMPLLTFTAERL